MFDYQVSKHPHFDEACRAFALRHNLVQLAERAGMNVQILRNKLNPAQPHLLTAPEIWLLTDLTEDSTLVSTVCQAGWRGKIGLSPFFVNSHTGSHFAQLLEFRYPEIFIQIQVAVITLGRAGIGAEEVKRGPVRKHHRIAFQLHLHFFSEVDDVLLKDVGLCLAGGKENLVTSGKQSVKRWQSNAWKNNKNICRSKRRLCVQNCTGREFLRKMMREQLPV